MFVDLRTLSEGETLGADVCIVGAGAAGIALALELKDSGLKVILVESGGLGRNKDVQALCGGENTGIPDNQVAASRYRGFGGTTMLWAGHCLPLAEIDFCHRPWVKYSGWPFSKSDLDPYYRRAQAVFGVADRGFEPERWAEEGLKLLKLDGETVDSRICHLYIEGNFDRLYRDAFKVLPNVTVLLHATVTEVTTDDDANEAMGVVAATLDGNRVAIRSRAVVLAGGGIENARLLLLSDAVMPGGLGNRHDVVGRYFTQHPHVPAAAIQFNGQKDWLKSYKDHKRGGLWIRANLAIGERAQREKQSLNGSAMIVERSASARVDEVKAVGFQSFKRIALDCAKGRRPRKFKYHAARILGDLDGLAVGLVRYLIHNRGGLLVRSEQAPNPDSRITLSDERDLLGQRKPHLDWRLTAFDKRSVGVMVDRIGSEFQRLGIGDVTPDPWLLTEDAAWPASIHGGFHHMGTTRMSDDPRTGVTDSNGAVHGVHGLFIAGCSVFPTGGYANPTLTLLATTIRLADHIKEKFGQ